MPFERTKYEFQREPNLDPLTGEPGAHPVGVGTGAAGGGITGAMIGGAIGGPIGAGIGAVVGAVGGGFAGKGVAEAIDPTVEHAYWRKEYVNRPYVMQGEPYEYYSPAYQYGWEIYPKYAAKGKGFEDFDFELRRDWESRREKSKLSWEQARAATHDAWCRVEKSCKCD